MNHIFFKLSILLVFFVGLSACSLDDVATLVDDNNTTITDDNAPDDVDKVDVTVNYVVDGDTVNVIMPDGSEESVRLLLIDTPESVHPDKPEQPFGEKASDFVGDLLIEGKTIQLEYDGPKRDKYNRLLAYVWLDEENINKKLLRKGLARYAYEYDPPYRYQEQFKEAEQQAEQERLNIWSIDGYVESDFEQY